MVASVVTASPMVHVHHCNAMHHCDNIVVISFFTVVHDCPDLSITNGMVTYQPPGTTHFIDTTATYDCNTGYTLSGNNVRTCQDVGNGMWNGSDPSCNCEYITVVVE